MASDLYVKMSQVTQEIHIPCIKKWYLTEPFLYGVKYIIMYLNRPGPEAGLLLAISVQEKPYYLASYMRKFAGKVS